MFDLMPATPMSKTKPSMFNGDEDAYWWVLCTEKYFAAKGISEAEKLSAGVSAMRGRALQWWLGWHVSANTEASKALNMLHQPH